MPRPLPHYGLTDREIPDFEQLIEEWRYLSTVDLPRRLDSADSRRCRGLSDSSHRGRIANHEIGESTVVSQSLRDQLVKAGLATTAQAKKAERSKRAETTAQRQQGKSAKGKKGKDGRSSTTQSETEKVKAKAALQRAAKAARDKALAQRRNEKPR